MLNRSSIPVIDISDIDGGGRGRVRDELMAAYSQVGFGYLVGHGIPTTLVDGVFEASRRFHALSTSEKESIQLNQLHRGYIPIGTSTDRNSTLAEVTRPNQSASFIMMREAGPTDSQVRRGVYLAGANQWPELNGFRTAVEAYNYAMVELARRVLGLFCEALGDDTAQLLEAFDVPTTWLRLLQYPPQSHAERDGVFGSAPHFDFGGITILAQDGSGGLQVQSVNGKWIDVEPRPGAFVLNTGDMMRRLSNGRLLATPHRVINRSGNERFSCPFFFDPDVETLISPLASCIDEQSPPQFEPIYFGQWLRHELEAGYDQHSSGPHRGP